MCAFCQAHTDRRLSATQIPVLEGYSLELKLARAGPGRPVSERKLDPRTRCVAPRHTGAVPALGESIQEMHALQCADMAAAGAND